MGGFLVRNSNRMPELPPAGWFPDHTNPGQLRYWDGSQWTNYYSPLVQQPPISSPGTSSSETISNTRPEDISQRHEPDLDLSYDEFFFAGVEPSGGFRTKEGLLAGGLFMLAIIGGIYFILIKNLGLAFLFSSGIIALVGWVVYRYRKMVWGIKEFSDEEELSNGQKSLFALSAIGGTLLSGMFVVVVPLMAISYLGNYLLYG